ncbi:16S rRNA (guanine(966)-N(2))-methyltransferase RsmD [Acholeplasma granularum]|uniref:16S rRNA (guanine(966)-N(2))-methyltransferase RsmD n=1 Tax=Acholeplasma granularum TaxID=264635 RepID=UPI00046E673F|nr:16S rRNA (guanine(966)-N(2))-methyltransferase RsmD [Acholeplasma granularum]
MRIIAGRHRSRTLKMVPSNDTRETSDKVRGAIFNSLSTSVVNANVLDLFAGSGAYGLESISRGASHVWFNDVKPKAIETIIENIKLLNEHTHATVWKYDYKEAINRIKLNELKLDLVFLDPPYEMNIYAEILDSIYENLNDDCLCILEMHKENSVNLNLEKYEITREKLYGIKKIIMLRKL